MKKVKIIMPIAAFMFALVGAITSANSNALTITGYTPTGPQGSCVSGQMDNGCTLNSGTRCQISSVNAFKLSDCTDAAFKN